MKKCPFCGKEIPDEMQFCPYCMKKLITPEKITPPLIKKRKFRIYVVCAAVALLLSGAVLLAVMQHNRKLVGSGNFAVSDSATESRAASVGDILSNNENSEGKRAKQSSSSNLSETGDSSNTSTGDNLSSYNNTAKQSTDGSSDSTIVKNNTTGGNASSVADNNPCANGHTWVAMTKIVHHDAVGHNEQIEVYNEVVKYKCPVCYEKFNSLNEYFVHFDAVHSPSYSGDPISIFRNQYETVSDYDVSYENKWVEDKKAYDETVITGYTCSVCGATK